MRLLLRVSKLWYLYAKLRLKMQFLCHDKHFSSSIKTKWQNLIRCSLKPRILHFYQTLIGVMVADHWYIRASHCKFSYVSVYLKCSDEETANLLCTHPDLIQVLSLTSAVNIIVNDTPPVGCAVQTVSAKCETHLVIKVRIH